MAEEEPRGEQVGDQPVVRVEFCLTREEFDRYLHWQFRHLPALRYQAFAIVSILVGAVVVFVTSSRALGASFLVAGAVVAGSFTWVIGSVPRRTWAKRGGDIAAKQVVEFSDDGIHTVTANTESTTDWTVYTRVVKLDGLYLLGTKSHLLFRIVPRRAFESPADEETFRRIVEAHLPLA